MRSITLSRRSGLYQFVFGDSHRTLVFPEPNLMRISSGSFMVLLMAAIILKLIRCAWFMLIKIGVNLITLLCDGSYVRGAVVTGFQKIAIVPWPTTFGYRVSPGIMLIALCGLYRGLEYGVGAAIEYCVYTIGTVLVVLLTGLKSGRPEVVTTTVSKLGKPVKTGLARMYYWRSSFFPEIYLIE